MTRPAAYCKHRHTTHARVTCFGWVGWNGTLNNWCLHLYWRKIAFTFKIFRWKYRSMESTLSKHRNLSFLTALRYKAEVTWGLNGLLSLLLPKRIYKNYHLLTFWLQPASPLHHRLNSWRRLAVSSRNVAIHIRSSSRDERSHITWIVYSLQR